jgi:cardiolipin synthase A/B
MKNFTILSHPPKIYKQMLKDIESAKKTIFLETYIYDDDKIGQKFKRLLTKKAKEGAKVYLLIDAWGSKVRKKYFKELIKNKGKVRFFREIKYVTRFLSKNHERNHRKLLIIDKKISYTGSINITASCLNWRELVLRLEGDISNSLYQSFIKSWNMFNKLKYKEIKNLIYKNQKIINDTPLYPTTKTHKNYLKLIKNARKQILIETPYFIPTPKIIHALSRAISRKVEIKIILPQTSDVKIIDILRTAYLGQLHKKGIKIYFYTPKNLHSKLLIVDNQYFILGSSNLDYRSFIHQYEINLLGTDKKLTLSLQKHFNQTLSQTKPFNYKKWKERSPYKKILELTLSLIKKYL